MRQVHQLRPRVRLHRGNRRESGHRCSNRRRVRQHDRRHSLPQCRTIVLVGPLRRSNPREPFPLRLACPCSASYRSGRSNARRIAPHRLISGEFRALLRISARNGGDIRGWFQLISGFSAETNPPTCRGFAKKRLIGFEPTTFCMAITLASSDWLVRTSRFAGIYGERNWRSPSPICGDVRRYAAFRELLARSSRNRRGRFQSPALPVRGRMRRVPCRRISLRRRARSPPAARRSAALQPSRPPVARADREIPQERHRKLPRETSLGR